jgi:predicted signal transduction protein with EAL and GGDEF domain
VDDEDEEDAMACPRITLTGVTATVWECLRGRAASMGINLPPGAAGTVSHALADADYAWYEATDQLTVTFTRIPPIISCGDIEARIRLAAASCGAD